VISVLLADKLDAVTAVLGVARLYQGDGFYLVDWDGDRPVGHLHLALGDPPEIQDLEVVADQRGRGVGTGLIDAAEAYCSMTHRPRLAVTVSVANSGARALYERLGYVESGEAPVRVRGTVQLRTGPITVDDTLVRLEKRLAR